MVVAYERLPADVKDKIEGLRARHSIEASFGAAMPIEKRLALKDRYPDAEHPVVRTHPETGEKVLVVICFTTHFSNYHTHDRARFGQDYNPGPSELLRYLKVFDNNTCYLSALNTAGSTHPDNFSKLSQTLKFRPIRKPRENKILKDSPIKFQHSARLLC